MLFQQFAERLWWVRELEHCEELGIADRMIYDDDMTDDDAEYEEYENSDDELLTQILD